LPSGVEVAFFERAGGTDTLLGSATTTSPIFPGQVREVELEAPAGTPMTATFIARVISDETATFRECRDDNNESNEATPVCLE
jgi:hypothetical protein